MADPDRTGDTAGAPAWLKVAGIVVLVAVVLGIVVIVMLGGAGHTPGPPPGGH